MPRLVSHQSCCGVQLVKYIDTLFSKSIRVKSTMTVTWQEKTRRGIEDQTLVSAIMRTSSLNAAALCLFGYLPRKENAGKY